MILISEPPRGQKKKAPKLDVESGAFELDWRARTANGRRPSKYDLIWPSFQVAETGKPEDGSCAIAEFSWYLRREGSGRVMAADRAVENWESIDAQVGRVREDC